MLVELGIKQEDFVGERVVLNEPFRVMPWKVGEDTSHFFPCYLGSEGHSEGE